MTWAPRIDQDHQERQKQLIAVMEKMLHDMGQRGVAKVEITGLDTS